MKYGSVFLVIILLIIFGCKDSDPVNPAEVILKQYKFCQIYTVVEVLTDDGWQRYSLPTGNKGCNVNDNILTASWDEVTGQIHYKGNVTIEFNNNLSAAGNFNIEFLSEKAGSPGENFTFIKIIGSGLPFYKDDSNLRTYKASENEVNSYVSYLVLSRNYGNDNFTSQIFRFLDNATLVFDLRKQMY